MMYFIMYIIFALLMGVFWAWYNKKDSPEIMFVIGSLAAPFLLFAIIVQQIDNLIDKYK